MSNEPTTKRLSARPQAASTAPAEPASVAAERIAAALQRMESAVGAEPGALEQLRTELREMAHSIVQIRAAVDAAGHRYTAVGALLQDLERRADRMMSLLAPVSSPAIPRTEEQAFREALGVNAAAETAARPPNADQVPTVSSVVSQLGRGETQIVTRKTDQAKDDTNVAMLEAMIEQLAQAMPAPPAEMGAAVIFDKPTRPANARADRSAKTPAALDDLDLDLDAFLFEPQPEDDPDPAAFLMEPGPGVAPSPPPVPPPPRVATAPAVPRTAVPRTPAASEPGRPQPPIPAALPPVPQSTWNIEPPVPASVSPKSEVVAEVSADIALPIGVETPPPASADRAPPPAAFDTPPLRPPPPPRKPTPDSTAPYDPFAPIRAMSDEERIALFE